MTTTNKNTRFRDDDSLSNNKNDGSSNNNDLSFKKDLQISSSNGIRQLWNTVWIIALDDFYKSEPKWIWVEFPLPRCAKTIRYFALAVSPHRINLVEKAIPYNQQWPKIMLIFAVHHTWTRFLTSVFFILFDFVIYITISTIITLFPYSLGVLATLKITEAWSPKALNYL